MATFNPYNKAIKESINVDFKDRHSPQKVILCNRENQFYGEFIGTAKINGAFIDGGDIANVNLSNVNIYDADGNLIVLSDITNQLTNIKAVIDEQFPAISAIAIENREKIAGLETFTTDINLSLYTETRQRVEDDERLETKIHEVSAGYISADDVIKNDITEKWNAHKTDLTTLSNNIIDEVERLKHYSMVVVGPEFLDTFKLRDWATNKIAHAIPYAYENIKEESAVDTPTESAGRIVNVKFDGEQISAFDFEVPKGCPIKELNAKTELKTYHFTREEKEVYTGFYRYKLIWNTGFSDKFQMTLQGGEEYQYLALSDSNGNYVGNIRDFSIDVGKLKSGKVLLETIRNENLSVFDNMEFSGDTGYKYTEITGNLKLEATIKPNGVEVVHSPVSAQYQSLNYNGEKFGRIYEADGVEYDALSTISTLPVRLSADLENETINETIILNTSNGFKKFLTETNSHSLNYNFDNTITLKKEEVKYFTILKEFDSEALSVTDNVKGTISFNVNNINELPCARLSGFTLNLSAVDFDGEYKLVQSEITSLYKCDKNIEGGSTISFVYNTRSFKNFISYIYTQPGVSKATFGRFYVDLSAINQIDNSYVVLSDTVEFKDSKIEFPETDDPVEAFLSSDLNVQTEYGDKTYLLESVDCGEPKITVKIPSKLEHPGRAREFIVLIDASTSSAKPIKVDLIYDTTEPGESEYKFIFDERNVTDNLYIFESKVALRFTEVDTNKFVLEDLTNANLIHYINNRLRGGINYRGVVQVIDEDGRKTNKISNLFYTDGYPGWHFPRPEYADKNFSLINGNMFFVSNADNTETKRWVVEGIELEYGDYIIVNKDGEDSVRICDITSADIDVIDTIEKDHIIVDNLTVNENAYINRLSTDSLSSVSMSSDNHYTTNLTATNETVAELSVANEIATDLSVTNETVTNLSADSISVGLSDLKFETDGVISTASDISSNLSKRINENKDDITTISTDLSGLSTDYSEIKTNFNTTFWNNLSGHPWPDDNIIPHFLLLRDQVLTGYIYALEIRNGVLATKLMKKTY